MRRLLDVGLVLLVVVGAVGSACSRASSSSSEPDVSTTVDSEAASARFPADRIVWQAEYSDETLSPVALAAARPTVTIYGDGRIFVVDPGRDPRYDQPLSLRHGKVDLDVLAGFIAGAEASGLLDGADFGEVDSEDRTSITLRTHGLAGPHEVEVRSLGGRFDPLVSDEQAERREDLRLLLSAGEALLLEPEPHAPDRVRVLELGEGVPFEPVPEAVDEEEEHPWPGPKPSELTLAAPADLTGVDVAGCGEVTGSAASDLLSAAIENPSPVWNVDGTDKTIVVVDLLPHEVACGAASSAG